MNCLKVEEWYRMPEDAAIVKGFGGLSAIGNFVLTNDEKTGDVFRLDLTQPKGVPVRVPHTPNTLIDGGQDGIYLPPQVQQYGPAHLPEQQGHYRSPINR